MDRCTEVYAGQSEVGLGMDDSNSEQANLGKAECYKPDPSSYEILCLKDARLLIDLYFSYIDI